MSTGGGAPALSLVIPAYNEAENLPDLLEEIRATLRDHHYEIVLVDDGSTDGTPALLQREAEQDPRLKVIRFRRNFGQTAALQAGFDHAAGNIIVTLDADGQNPPKEIPKLLAALEQPGENGERPDLVCGFREKRRDEFKRVLISRLANRLIGRVTGTALRDYGCTLKAFRAWCTNDIHLYGEMHRFIPAYVAWQGGRITEVPVAHRPRTAGKSNYGWSRLYKVLLDLLTVGYFQGYANKPAYLFGGMGLVLMAVSGALAGFTLYQKYALGEWVHKNPLLLVAIFLALVGLQMLLMGLLGEVLMRTYHESGKRPTYRVARRLNLPGGDGG